MDNKDNEKYCIHREWIGDKKRTTEKIQVYKDDSYNQFLTDNWSMFIENILPSGLSNFFFFDGEKIAELAVEKTSNQMKESIKTLLGISVLELLKSDLGRIINRTVKNQVGNAEAEEVESLRHQKEIAEINLVAVDEELEKLEETRNILEQKLDVKNQEYIAKGGDIVTQRQELYQKRTALMSKIDNYKEQLVLDAASELPFLLVKDYLRNIRENSEIEQEQKMMEIALKKMNHFSKDYEKNNEQDSAAILRFMSYINKNSITKSHSISYNMSDSSLFKLQVLLDEQLLATKLNVIERQNKLKNMEQEVNQLDSYLSVDINEKEITRNIKNKINTMLEESGLEYKYNGLQEYAMPTTMNICFKGVSSEALMLSSKDFCSISNGSACNSKSYSPSYVLLAMGIPKDQIESSVRISWGHDITIDEIEKSFQNVIEAAKGLVW